VVKLSSERVAGVIPFGDATEDLVEAGSQSSPGENDRLIQSVSVLDVAPVSRNSRTARTELLDHGRDLTGQDDDDHTLYYHLDGIRALNGDVPLGDTTRDFTYLGNTSLRVLSAAVQNTFLGFQGFGGGAAPHILTLGTPDHIGMHIEPKGTSTLLLGTTDTTVQFGSSNLKTDGTNSLNLDMYYLFGNSTLYLKNTGGANVANLDVEGSINIGGAITGGAHKDNHDPEDGSDPLDCAAPSELGGVQAAGEGSAHEFARSDHAHQIQHGITDNHLVTVDDSPNSGEYVRFTADGIEGRTEAEFTSDHTQFLLADGTRNVTGDITFETGVDIRFISTNAWIGALLDGTLLINANTTTLLEVNGVPVVSVVAGGPTIGAGVAGVDYTLTFDGEDNDGIITWMEDEARFDFDSDVDVAGNITLTGTVDERDVDADGTKLDGIDAAARAAHALLDGDVHTDSAVQGVTQGSIIYGNATPAWDELPIGNFKKYIRSTGTVPAWSDLEVSDDSTPQCGGNLDMAGYSLKDDTRAYVVLDDQLYVTGTIGVGQAPVSFMALATNPSGNAVSYGIFGGVTYGGASGAVYGTLFTSTHSNAAPTNHQYAYGLYCTTENQGVAAAGKDVISIGCSVKAENSGAQLWATADGRAYSMYVQSAEAGSGGNAAGNFLAYSLFVEDATAPGGTPTSSQKWCALFEGDIQINSDKRLYLEGTNTAKGDTYIVYDSASTTVDFFVSASEQMNLSTTALTVDAGLILTTNDGVDYTPGGDLDTDIATITVTGTPKLWWDESEDAFAFTHRVIASAGVQTAYSTDNVADPPTDAELDTAFGDPTTVGSGFIGVLDDNNAGTDCYICWTTGTAGEWFYVKGTKAV
jgi:hypothetical protein